MSLRRVQGLSLISVACVVLSFSSPVRAHFLWMTAEPNGDLVKVQAFLAEPPIPDLPMFMDFIKEATYSANGSKLEPTTGEETYLLNYSDPTPTTTIDGLCPLGVMNRDEVPFRLFYSGRLQFGPVDSKTPELNDHLRVRLESNGVERPYVQVTFQGKPAASASVKAYYEDGSTEELRADENGRLVCNGVAEGKTGLLAKLGDGQAGELDGEFFDETRFYATLTIAPTAVLELIASDDETVVAPARIAEQLPLLPEPNNSFGGAVAGEWLYVYSGHTGTTHRYHKGTTIQQFRRLNLKDGTTWEELPCGPDLQGVSLVEHNGFLYRTGGMSAQNAEDEEHDLVSTDEAALFDPETKTWTLLRAMPEPRSTHDAIPVGDHLYVVGGWAMLGGGSDNTFFHEEMLRLDLNDPEAEWEVLPQPFLRRALAAATINDKLFVLGGLTEDGNVVTDVDIFDPATETWSKGPELPGAAISGFAPSAFGVQGRLYVTGMEGEIHRLSTDETTWELVGRLAVPRITHRLLPGLEGDLIAVGGNFSGVPIRFIERFRPDADQNLPVVLTGEVTMPGEAVKSHALNWTSGKLVIAGGSKTWSPHAFEAEYLTDQVLEFSIATLKVEPSNTLPELVQSSTVVTVPAGGRGVPHLLGGIGHDGEFVRTIGAVHRFDKESGQWTTTNATIPYDRGMFTAAVNGNQVWIFGGSVFDPRPDADQTGLVTEVLRWKTDREGSSFQPTGIEMPHGRRSFAGAVLDGKFYAVGGIAGMGIVEEVDVFEFDSGTWSQVKSPLSDRVFPELAVVDGALFLAGGFSRGEDGHFEPTRTVECFDPESGAWSIVLGDLPIETGDTRMISIGNRLLFFGVDRDDPSRAHFAIVAP